METVESHSVEMRAECTPNAALSATRTVVLQSDRQPCLPSLLFQKYLKVVRKRVQEAEL